MCDKPVKALKVTFFEDLKHGLDIKLSFGYAIR